MLKLRWARVLIWFVISIVLGVIVLSLPVGDRLDMPLVFGAIPGLAGMATAGQRSRPWMSLVGGALSALPLACFFSPEQLEAPLYVMPSANLIYGAVMLYGTDPRPRGEATSNN